jgi:sugar-specific transcriptional regulator TrmB
MVTPEARPNQFNSTATRVDTPTLSRRPIRPVALQVASLSSRFIFEISTEEIAALQMLGLTLNEARTYLTLLKKGALKASELSFQSQVPRSKLYATVRLLDKRGLVHIAPSKPETFTAVSPSAFLVERAKEISDQAASVLEILQELGAQQKLRTANSNELGFLSEANELWHIEGRKHIYDSVNKMLRSAANSVSYYATASGLVRAYKAHAESLEGADKRGATVRLLMRTTRHVSSVAKELAVVVRSRRTVRPLGVNFVCIDRRELVVMEDSPGDFDVEKGEGTAAWTTNRLLVEAYEDLFEKEWKNSSPLQ